VKLCGELESVQNNHRFRTLKSISILEYSFGVSYVHIAKLLT